MNLTEMSESYEGTLHDSAVFRISLLTSDLRATPEADLDEDERATINASARDIYLSCAFIVARSSSLRSAYGVALRLDVRSAILNIAESWSVPSYDSAISVKFMNLSR